MEANKANVVIADALCTLCTINVKIGGYQINAKNPLAGASSCMEGATRSALLHHGDIGAGATQERTPVNAGMHAFHAGIANPQLPNTAITGSTVASSAVANTAEGGTAPADAPTARTLEAAGAHADNILEASATVVGELPASNESVTTDVIASAVTASARKEHAGKWRRQKFCESWLKDDRFSKWLVKVPTTPFQAKCKVCDKILRTGKSELEKHANAKYHLKAMRAMDGSNTPPVIGVAEGTETSVERIMDKSVDSSFQVDEDNTPQQPVRASTPVKRTSYTPPPARWAKPNVAPRVQSYAPEFKGLAVLDNRLLEAQLSDYQGKFLVLFFYPQDFCLAGCNELVEHSDRIADFRDANAEVLAVSPDSHHTHLAWTNTPRRSGGLGRINFPLLADFNKKMAKDYNVHLEETGMALRASFIIDPRGMVRHMTVNDMSLVRSADETLRLLRVLQHFEMQPLATRASWQPPEPTNETVVVEQPTGSMTFRRHMRK